MVSEEGLNASPIVTPILSAPEETPVTDELQRLTRILVSVCPKDSAIKFYFDGTLRLQIDVRRLEELAAMESQLPTMCGGIFHDVQRRLAERHSFFHRLTATVRR